MLKDNLLVHLVCAILIVVLSNLTFAQRSIDPSSVELARQEEEYSSVRFEPARMNQQSGLAVIFTGTHDLHYYARAETAPADGFELKISAKSNGIYFSKLI